jgi:hypothetical protein
MGNKSDSNPKTRSIPRFPVSDKDDLSTNFHRQVIGIICISFPFLLLLVSLLRPTKDNSGIQFLNSISDYYFSESVGVFSGMLSILAFLLFTYRGYENRFHNLERATGVLGGLAALGIVLFPTGPKDPMAHPWWNATIGYVHVGSAILLFSAAFVFSLFLFRLSNFRPGSFLTRRNLRDKIYVFCGIGIFACMIWAGLAKLNTLPIFLPESVALELCGISWFIKGQGVWSLRQLKVRIQN